MYNAEVAPPHLRGGMNILFQWFVTIGILAAGLINYGCDYINGWGWRLSLGLSAVPGFIVFFGGIIMPESPTSLIERGHYEKAHQVRPSLSFTLQLKHVLFCCILLGTVLVCCCDFVPYLHAH